MFLQEEYLTRHGITDVPIINHITNGSLLLKMENGYLLMTIAWREHDRHPGSYYINYYTPVHNGHADGGRYFNRITDVERELEWDEYHSYISSWVKGQIMPVCGDKEVILAAWEIFVFCCDGMLVDFTSNTTLEKLIYNSLNEDASIDERFQGYQDCLAYISVEFPSMLKVFKHDVLPHIQYYCHWLAKLINSYNEVHSKQN